MVSQQEAFLSCNYSKLEKKLRLIQSPNRARFFHHYSVPFWAPFLILKKFRILTKKSQMKLYDRVDQDTEEKERN
jgi:hypothetical protein